MGTYRTSTPLIVSAVQPADTKTIAADLRFINVNDRSKVNSSPEKVLVIAKEATIRSQLRQTLEVLGFDAGEASDEEGALVRLRMMDYEAILLEHRKYEADGVAICKRIRGLYPRLPILAVASRSSLERKLATFEAGADDCMIWPLSERELSARLRSAIRGFRASAVSSFEFPVIGEIALDPVRLRATKSGSDVPLTPTEFSVLETLMRQPGIPISHSILVVTIWGQESKANREHLRVVISSLRRKLEDDPSDPRYLITHACYGYCFRDR
jgi:two-component system, OmpR family, KDP operon response regulator KdpE